MMLKTETKWKWFKWFIRLIMLIAGGLTALSLRQWDLTLFAVSLALMIGVLQLSMIIGFIDAVEGP